MSSRQPGLHETLPLKKKKREGDREEEKEGEVVREEGRGKGRFPVRHGSSWLLTQMLSATINPCFKQNTRQTA